MSKTVKPAPAEELKKVDAYWRAANYLAAAQLYMLKNPLLRRSVPTSLKRYDVIMQTSRAFGLYVNPMAEHFIAAVGVRTPHLQRTPANCRRDQILKTSLL